ncbi:hypothetical protein C2I18_23875 [Paenibacillus sp. PK3_47]|uniref:DUF4179 domain-containing protein n=1 Tax=Paenibacillus sp. PK3_47 TaxID=2072642 RepID=UPI00201D3C00|nr:DUF4179 domain-containing protein [Paenibacillus sp. PK3_47]UQZ36293.1 hypothetical protein C2I18_23875 [Paenibacillus sp. PK3_47]
MAEIEEKLLRDYFQEMDSTADAVSDMKLDAAIHQGIRSGRNKASGLRKSYAAAVLVILAAVLLVSIPWIFEQMKPQQAVQTPKSWGELEVYRQVIGDNLTVSSALDAGFVQQVNFQSPEADGLQMTVNGVIADRRGVILLYTLVNHTDQKFMYPRFTLKKNEAALNDLTSESFSGANNNSLPDGGGIRNVMHIPWENLQETLPDQVYATLTMMPADDNQHPVQGANGEVKLQRLSVMIDLDESAEYAQGSSVELKATLSVAGQKIRMNNVYIGPTGIYMNEVYDGKNTMKIFGLYGLKMKIGTGTQMEELRQNTAYSYNGGPLHYVFANDNMQPGEPVRLEIEGLYAIEKTNLEVVINTETRQILKAPDDRLSLSERMDGADSGALILDLTMPAAEEDTDQSGSVSLDYNFVDGEGAGRWLEPRVEQYSSYMEYRNNGKESVATFFYNLGAEKLPQPLTFKLNYYPGLITGDDSLRIR